MKNKGISLISLIIIVMIILILACITLLTLLRESQIVQKSTNLVEKYEQATIEESKQLDSYVGLIDSYKEPVEVSILKNDNKAIKLLGFEVPLSSGFEGDVGQAISQVFAENLQKTIAIAATEGPEVLSEVIIDIHYDLQLLNLEAIYPAGTLEIKVPAPNLNTTDTQILYDTSAEDEVFTYATGLVAKDGYVTLTNKIAVNSTTSGNVKVRFRINVRNCITDVNGEITYTGMKASLISTAPGYTSTDEGSDLTFTITTRKDEVTIQKVARKTAEYPNGLTGTAFNGNYDDYYWVDYRITATLKEYNREITEIEIIDNILDNGTLVQMVSREPEKNGITMWYTTSPTTPLGYTLTGNSFKYSSTTNFEIDVELTVMYDKNDFVGEGLNIENTVSQKTKHEGMTALGNLQTDTAQISTGNIGGITTGSLYALGRNLTSTHYTAGYIVKGENILDEPDLEFLYRVTFGKRNEGDKGDIEIGLDAIVTTGNFTGTSYYELTSEDMYYKEVNIKALPGCSGISVYGMADEYSTTWELIQTGIDSDINNTISIPSNKSFRLKVVFHSPSLFINVYDYNGENMIVEGVFKLTNTGAQKLTDAQISEMTGFHSMDLIKNGVPLLAGSTSYTDDAGIIIEPIHQQIYGYQRYWHFHTREVPWSYFRYNFAFAISTYITTDYEYNATSKYYENTMWYCPTNWPQSIILSAHDVVHLLPEGIEYIPDSSNRPVDIIDNYMDTNRQLIIIHGTTNTRSYLKTRIKDINIYNDINSIDLEAYLVCTSPDATETSGPMLLDDGSEVNAWVDLNQNGKTDEYVKGATYTVNILKTLDSNAQAIKTQVKTTDMSAYGISGEEKIGGVFTYKLSVSTLSNIYKNVIIYDVLPHIGDEFYNGLSRESETDLIFVDIDLSEAIGMGYDPVIYYSTSTTPGDLNSGDWTTTKPENLDIKAIAIDFGEGIFEENSTVAAYIKVKSHKDINIEGSRVYNSFYYEKMHKNTSAEAWIQDAMLETSPVEVTFIDEICLIEIEKILADGQSSEVLAGGTVNYKIIVTNTGTADLHDLVITDSLDSTWEEIIDELLAGESETFTFTYTVPSTVTNGQTIKNIATVVSNEMPEKSTDDEDVTVIEDTPVKTPSYTIDKSLKAGQESSAAPGEEVIYVITVINTGEVDLHNLIITDSLDDTWIKEVEILPHTTNNILTYEFTYTIPEESTDGQVIKNIAAVECDDLDEITDDQDITVVDEEIIIDKILDFALETFITKVNDKDITNRSNDPVRVEKGDIVIYTIIVYNEGEVDGYIQELICYIPDGLEYIEEHEINLANKWSITDNDAKTRILSIEENIDNKIAAYQNDVIDYKEVQIALKVTSNESGKIIENIVEINEHADANGVFIEDIDSTPGNMIQGEDDIDSDFVIIKDFDLRLTKQISGIEITVGNNITKESKNMLGLITKIDLDGRRLNQTTVDIIYQIEVKNEGEVAGYVKKVKDYIPEGLRFNADKNPKWTLVEENVAQTEQFENTLLLPNEKATVEIILEWIGNQNTLGTKINIAEISMIADKYEEPIRDATSIPDNKNIEENDLDAAVALITIITGVEKEDIDVSALILAIIVPIMLGIGMALVMRYVLKNKKS